MINISKIDNNLSIYKENNVIIFNNSDNSLTQQIIPLLQSHDITISSICDSSFTHSNNPFDINLISLEELKNQDLSNVIIQLSNPEMSISQSGFPCDKVISFVEAFQIINFIDKLGFVKQFPQLLDKQILDNKLLKENQTKQIQENILNSIESDIILLCLPPKTGDHTIMQTFSNLNLNYHMLWHTPSMFLKEQFLSKDAKFKIISAIREPISRDISTLYQGLEFITSSPMIDALNLHEMSTHIMSNGGDAQNIFDLVFNSKDGKNSIDDFLLDFKQNILDLSAHPFDKDLGYTIIKDGNIEIFLYQLEKLDTLSSQLGDWLNISIDGFIKGNSTSDKWVNSSYQQAKQKIQINQDYFDKSFSSDWINHFYSNADIERFKSKWALHLS